MASPNDIECGEVLVRGVDLTDLGLLPTFFILVLSRSLAMLSYLGVLWPIERGVLRPSLRGVPESNYIE